MTHGTYGGYQQHKKYGTQPCDACLDANADYMRERRRRRGDTTQVLVDVQTVRLAADQCSPEVRKALLQALRGVQA